jgi:hypothetical protein
MKSLPFLLFVLTLLLIVNATAAPARPDIDGFQGMRWGSTLSDLQRTKKLVLTKESDAKGESLYALQGAPLRFGKATLTGIHCSFFQERLGGVILLFAGAKNFAAVKTEAMSRFGESTKIEQKGEEMYTWTGDITSIVLSYNRGAASGFLFLKPKKPLPPIKGQQAKQSKTPTPKAPERTSAATASDGETALDRASLPEPPGGMQGSPSGAGTSTPGTVTGSGPIPPSPSAPQLPGAVSTPTESVSPEVQRLIDRDRELTRLCWDTVGPAADDACREMRTNAQRLQEMGWCMRPDDGAGKGAGVVWLRCISAPAVAPTAPPTAATGQTNREALCRTVGELFSTAAWMRDDGATPQATEDELVRSVSGRGGQLGIERIRETVELVYFDPDYSGVRGTQIAQQVEDDCLSGFGPYNQPLSPQP